MDHFLGRRPGGDGDVPPSRRSGSRRAKALEPDHSAKSSFSYALTGLSLMRFRPKERPLRTKDGVRLLYFQGAQTVGVDARQPAIQRDYLEAVRTRLK